MRKEKEKQDEMEEARYIRAKKKDREREVGGLNEYRGQ